MNSRQDFAVQVLAPAAFTLALFLLWELVCRAFKLPLTILPAPMEKPFPISWAYDPSTELGGDCVCEEVVSAALVVCGFF